MDDDEIERLARSYAGNDYRDRRMVKVIAIDWSSAETYSFDDFVKMLNRAVPKKCRDQAKVEYIRGRYDEGDNFEVSYERPETDEEVNDRIQRAQAYAHESKDKERHEYERLRLKFGK